MTIYIPSARTITEKICQFLGAAQSTATGVPDCYQGTDETWKKVDVVISIATLVATMIGVVIQYLAFRRREGAGG